LFHVGFFVALMSQSLETTVPRFRTTPIMPASTSQIPVANAQSVDDSAEFMPAMHSVADVEDEAPMPVILGLDSNSLPARDGMTSVEQTPSVPSVGVFASDRMFVREDPW